MRRAVLSPAPLRSRPGRSFPSTRRTPAFAGRFTSLCRNRAMHPPRLGHANLGLGVGLRTVHFPYILKNQPAGGLVRDHLRELHGLRRPAALRPRTDRRALPRRHARRLAVDRQHRPARLRLSEKAQAPGRRRQRPLGVRPPVLDRRGRAQRPRPAAHPAQRGDAGPRRRPRPHRAGLPRTAAGAGEPQHLRRASPTRR